MANKYIPVVFITDDYYVIPTAVAIQSLIDNKNKETKYAIYIISTSLSDDNIKHFYEFESETIKISIIKENVTNLLNLHKYDTTGKCQATPSALLKFKLPILLSQYEKVIYLDGDILVKKDLSDLYNIDLGNNYVAAVHDTGKIYNSQKITKKIPNYFNSGVMLLNLKLCASKNMPKKLMKLKQKSKDMSLMDQNILNIGFRKHVKMLDIKYNFLVLNLNRAIDKFQMSDLNNLFHSEYKSLQDIDEQAYVVHFSSKDKPWKYLDGPYSQEWFKYFQKSPYKEHYLHRTKFSTLMNKIIKKEIIISLTSYPVRIDTVNQTIKTLLNQTMKADRVILWLAPEQFPNKEKDLPKQLLDLCEYGLTIDWYHDIKSYKKLIPTLKKYPDSIIVTVDDDALYNKDMLKNLYESYLLEPNAIHCHRAHKITLTENKINKYKEFIWFNKLPQTIESDFKLFFTGIGGVLYPPHSLSQNVLNESEFMSLCPHGDDIWFWGNAILNGTKIKRIIKSIQPEIIDGTQDCALWLQNVDGGRNDEQIANLINKYPQILNVLSPKKSKIQVIISRLLYPFYILAKPIIKFIKHWGKIFYNHSYRGKTDMLNMNFRKIVQSIESLQNIINEQNEKNTDKFRELESLITNINNKK